MIPPISFGKYFQLEGNTLHVPQNVYMVPNGVAQAVLESNAGPVSICQVNGTGEFRFFIKLSQGQVEAGKYFEQGDRPEALDRALEIEVVRDLAAPEEKLVKLWKAIHCNGLVVNDWGVPFAVIAKKPFSESKSICEAIVKASPEPCFVLLTDEKKKSSYCISKNEKDKVSVLQVKEKNEQEIARITQKFTEIFLVQEAVLIHPDPRRRDLT